MRYSEWFKRAGDALPSARAVEVGRKLLGYLSIRRQTPGVQTLVERVTLDDGTVVEAAFYGDQPRVIIHTPNAGDACELYVESGMLDLGPNIAADASQRFNRGIPEFDNRPATLYFGDGVECAEGEPGLNGRVSIDTGRNNIASQCLPKQGSGIESRLSDPAKKQAQAMLPASCWSGLMQRYVQAVYGGNALTYSANPSTLTIEGHVFDARSSWGLLDLNGYLVFADVGDNGSVAFYSVAFKSPCHQAAAVLWRSMPQKTEVQAQRKLKVLSIALSGAVVGSKIGDLGGVPVGNRHFTERSAWTFHPNMQEATAVLENDGTAEVHILKFRRAGQEIQITNQVIATGAVLNNEHWPLMQSSGSPYNGNGPSLSGFSDGSGGYLRVGNSYDFPVASHYDSGGNRVVVRCAVITANAGIVDTSKCHDIDVLHAPVIVGSDKENQCTTSIGYAVSVAYGFYSDSWSTVRNATCFVSESDNTVVVRSRPASVVGIDGDLELKLATNVVVNSTGPDFYAPGGDPYGLAAWSGVHSSGCQKTNAANGSVGVYAFLQDPDDTPCVTRYVDVGPRTFTTTYQTEYFALNVALFQGSARSIGVQFLSKAWGSNDCIVVDSYDLSGGDGGYASLLAGCNHFRSGNGVTLAASLRKVFGSFETTFLQYNYDTPGDCGSTQSLVGPVPGDVQFSLERPDDEGVLSASANGAFAVEPGGKILFQPVDSLMSLSSIYSYPATRGVETARTHVIADFERSTSVVSREVDLYRADGAGVVDVVHVEEAPPYVANDSIAGQCQPFFYCGMHELQDDHINLPLANENGKAWALQEASGRWLLEGFAYQSARSLLGSRVFPIAQADRGASIHMDRHAITGGYPTVNTPSFVGWA